MLVGISEIAPEIYMLNFCNKETTFNPIVTHGIVLITQTLFFLPLFGAIFRGKVIHHT